MSFTQNEENRVATIEAAVNTLNTALLNSASKKELKNLIALLTKDITGLKESLIQLELTGYANALANHQEDPSAHAGELSPVGHGHNDTYFQKTEFVSTSVGAADGGKPVKLNGSGQIDASLFSVDDNLAAHTANLSNPHQTTAAQVGASYTQETFTITIDPAVAVNPSATPFITTQAEATARGAFKTMSAASLALPDNILYRVVFSHVDGQHDPTDYDLLGDFARFKFGTGNADDFPNGYGHIAIKSANPRARVAGTSQMAVASAPDGTEFNLAADPGFTVDQYAGYHISVVSGTGAGQYKSIRRNSGTNFKVCGRFSPVLNATSVVEIVEPKAWINMDAKFYGMIQGVHIPNGQQVECIRIEDIDFRSTVGVGIDLIGVSVAFIDSRFIGVEIDGTHSFLTTNNGIWDGKNIKGSFGLVSINGGYFRAWSSNSSWLIRKSIGSGLRLLGGSQSALQTCVAHLFEGAIDDNADSGVVLEGPFVHMHNATRLHGTGNGDWGVRMLRDAYYYPRTSDFSSGTQYLRGTLGEISIDDSTVSYADVVAEADKVIIGKFKSIVDGNQPLVP